MVTITTLDDSSYIAPTDAELRRLKAIVFAGHPDIEAAASHLTDFDAQFRRAMLAVGHMYRLPTPSKKHYFSFYVDAAQTWLTGRGLGGVAGCALLAAVFAQPDICWSAADDSGGVLELGLDIYSGQKGANAWRELLKGTRTLRPPEMRPAQRRHPSEFAPRPRITREDGSLVGPGESLWAR